MQQSVPTLCGGTFFTLLLRFRKPGSGSRGHYNGKKDNFTESEMLNALVKIAVPDLPKGILGSVCTDFKKCKKSFNSFLGNDEQVGLVAEAFDTRVINDYKSTFESMENFVNQYITSEESIQVKLVKELLDLICQDKSIQDNEKFYVCETGMPLKEIAHNGGKINVYFSAFLLGIWHFSVVHRTDNKIGEATFQSWHEQEGGPGTRWIYIGNLGKDYKGEICLLNDPPTDPDNFVIKVPDDVVLQNDTSDNSGINIPRSEAKGKILVEDEPSASDRVAGENAVLSVPKECRICLCCKDWHGNVLRAFRDPDGIYGDCDAQGKRVLSTGTCTQFRTEYSRALQYQEYRKLPHTTIFRQR